MTATTSARPHPSVSERVAKGKDARKRVPRSSHGAWEPAADRPDPVQAVAEQGHTRVPDLVPIRHGRMAVSAFTFFRGAAKVMANDLAAGPRTGINVQLCGDAHLANFGGFASPEISTSVLVYDPEAEPDPPPDGDPNPDPPETAESSGATII